MEHTAWWGNSPFPILQRSLIPLQPDRELWLCLLLVSLKPLRYYSLNSLPCYRTLEYDQPLPLQVKISVTRKFWSLALTLFLQFWIFTSSSQCHQYGKKSLFLLLSARSSESHSHLQALILSQSQPPLFPRPFSFGLTDTSAVVCAFLLLPVPPLHPFTSQTSAGCLQPYHPCRRRCVWTSAS